MNQKKIGTFIAKKRKEKNFTQQELAEKIGVTNRTILNWENGKNMPDYSLLIPLCENLEITIDELINGETTKQSKDTIELIIDYLDRNHKVNLKQKRILGKIFLIGGSLVSLFIMTFIRSNSIIYYQIGIPNPDIYITIGTILAIIGFTLINKKYHFKKRLILNIIFIIGYLSILTIYDTVNIIIYNQPPRFSTSALFEGNAEMHQTIFYNVYRCYNKDNIYHFAPKNKEVDFTRPIHMSPAYYYCNEITPTLEW